MKDKTRILVTHAVDFIHLADHIIIMKDGKVQAQGAYDELIFHPYMIQVQDIHSKNKKEIDDANFADALPELVKAKTHGHATATSSDYLSSSFDTQPVLGRHISQSFAPKNSNSSLMTSFEGRQLSSSSSKGLPPLPPASDRTDSQEELVDLSEGDLDKKIVSFRGLKNSMDEKMSKTIGKLLVDEADEDVSANHETYAELFKLVGGYKTVTFIAVTTIYNKYFDAYS